MQSKVCAVGRCVSIHLILCFKKRKQKEKHPWVGEKENWNWNSCSSDKTDLCNRLKHQICVEYWGDFPKMNKWDKRKCHISIMVDLCSVIHFASSRLRCHPSTLDCRTSAAIFLSCQTNTLWWMETMHLFAISNLIFSQNLLYIWMETHFIMGLKPWIGLN